MIESGTLLQDRFLIEEQIGVGGMGAVYRAVDQKFGTSVAVKETFYSDRNLAEAFEREARLLNGLHHPLFPHVSDHFVEGNGHFLVMEYIEGEDVSALLKRGERSPLGTVMRWTLDLLDGLDYLHSQDPPIIHRDVKPSNLKLTPRGNLLLLDFGMAKETSGDTQGMQSVFGYSRRYSPLEQIEGTGTDVRSDIFSLGATVYHLLTGAPPVDVLARASAIVAGKSDPLKLASEIDSNVPELIAALIHSALALNPAKRFVSARAMWNSVEEALRAGEPPESAVSATPITPAIIRQEETFPALEAFEEDPDLNPLTTPADPFPELAAKQVSELKAADGVTTNIVPEETERIEIPVISGADPVEDLQQLGSVDLPREEFDNKPLAEESAGGPDPAMQVPAIHSNRSRQLLWLPVILLLFGLLTYGLYSSSSKETGIENSASEQTASSEQTSPGEQTVSQTGDTEPAVNEPEDHAVSNEADDPEVQQSMVVRKNSVGDEKAGESRVAQNTDQANAKLKADPERSARTETRGDSLNKTRTSRATHPRVAGPAPGEPPVSSIESVLTGTPDRYHQQRQWEVWEQEEVRRQRRLRRRMQQNRLPYPY